MSKKAKRATPMPRNWTAKGKPGKPKRRPTALDHANATVNNLQGLLDQAEAKIVVMTDDATRAADRIASLLQNSNARQQTIDSQRNSIAKLKAIISGLEKDVARGEGTISALTNQIDQAADKVMVQPAVMASPQEVRRMRGTPDRRYAGDAFEGLTRSSPPCPTPQHWSDL